MGPMGWRSKRPNVAFVVASVTVMLGLVPAARAEASWFHRANQPAGPTADGRRPQEAGLRISAQVDRAAVEIGQQVVLTIALEGELAQATLQSFEFPKPFALVAQQRASNVSVGAMGMIRTINLIYVLVPREAGTFQLGPFQVLHHGTSVETEPIRIVVKKPVLPPNLGQEPRFTL